MKIIAGLGNPGEEYVLTRHNVGFMVVDRFFSSLKFKEWILRRDCLITYTLVKGERLYLCKPLTYMNNSGKAILDIMKLFKMDIKDLMVVYDDVDLPLGMLRVRSKGSSGGHKGVESIIYHLQSDAFPRIRVGIGPKPENVDMKEYVLSEFTEEELVVLNEVLDRAVEALKCVLYRGIEKAMQEFNRRVKS